MSDSAPQADPGRVHPFPLKRYKVTTITVWQEFYFLTAASGEEAIEKVRSGEIEYPEYGVRETEFPVYAEPSQEHPPTLEEYIEGRGGQ